MPPGIRLADLSIKDLKSACSRIEEDVYQVLGQETDESAQQLRVRWREVCKRDWPNGVRDWHRVLFAACARMIELSEV